MNTKSFKFKLIMFLTLYGLAINVFANHSGEHLYKQHCAACHGNTGDGGVGVPLSLPDFQSSISNEYLRKTIRIGRSGRVMPAFTQLSDADVNAIIKYMRSFAKVKIPKENKTKIKGNINSGKKLYRTYCSVCHGAFGEGGQGTGVTFSRPRNLPIMSPALNNSGFLASATDHMIKRAVVKGRRGTPMISYKEQGLSDSNINDIVSYVRSFEKFKPKKKQDELSPIISFESTYSVAETVESIKRAAIGKNFKIIRTQTLDNGFVADGKGNAKQTIVYFCNFSLLNQSLGIDPRVGMFLPCRVTVVEQKGKVTVMAINPLRLSKLFNNSELDRSCRELRDIYIEIIEEALL
ncbi:MAG: c-type cytochrome [Thiohalomonadales bacterium]